MRICLAGLTAMVCLNAGGQDLETGEWQMFGAPMPTNQDNDYEWSRSLWVAPVWFYNTRTGAVSGHWLER